MVMALLSLLCSFFLFLTWWLVLPILVLGPLSIYFAFKSYKQAMARFPGGGIGVRLLALTPMFTAIATFPLMVIFFNNQYQA
jgi:hypothetical protein